MAILTGEQIRQAARDTKIERAKMTVPEIGGDIYVRGMSGIERQRITESHRIRKGGRAGQLNLPLLLIAIAARVIVDEDGNRLLNDGDVEVLGRLPSGVIDRIISKTNELSGMTDEESDELGNDSASQEVSAASSSSSPLDSTGEVLHGAFSSSTRAS